MSDAADAAYDAILLVSFGGPEGPADVIPFLENVLRGRNVPRARLEAVAEHYQHFGGVSPINAQNRALIGALRQELAAHGLQLPIYWGNRNWHPLLTDTLAEMAKTGIRRALAFVTSAFSSYSGCRQYRENIEQAREFIPAAPRVDKLRVFFNHPGFIQAQADRARQTLREFPQEVRNSVELVFTAHSIPLSMAEQCAYTAQLSEACRLVCQELGVGEWTLAYQSRSGPATQPWLEPDVGDVLRDFARTEKHHVMLVPIGFISDHMEVVYDLDTEAQAIAEELGLRMVRAPTVGIHPQFVGMIRDLIRERVEGSAARACLGNLGPSHDVCPLDCCAPPRREPPARDPATPPTT